METTFKPMMAIDREIEFKNLLLRGFGIRKDNGGHDYYDVIERKKIDSSNGGVGYGDHKHTKAADNVLKKVLKTLDKAGYVIMTKAAMDGYKGRFRAVTYYLAEE
jgi:hypothetical protein